MPMCKGTVPMWRGARGLSAAPLLGVTCGGLGLGRCFFRAGLFRSGFGRFCGFDRRLGSSFCFWLWRAQRIDCFCPMFLIASVRLTVIEPKQIGGFADLCFSKGGVCHFVILITIDSANMREFCYRIFCECTIVSARQRGGVAFLRSGPGCACGKDAQCEALRLVFQR